ncbi:hypothetical protein AVDCRST_MAG81-891 [uncultured Synechococcales cyanobacterium]|uniref:Uncharacterized protein n=1 Tax=uncultured Synechococcales cyanobacterium TaxID=1936017 RepID=A0A6J4UYH9_9CYAN|nr:hypothetical protein AVDCRST_MAG81-891 [uncultured Synechococcales cyanobacterium]
MELYNLETDISEQQDVTTEYPEVGQTIEESYRQVALNRRNFLFIPNRMSPTTPYKSRFTLVGFSLAIAQFR